MSTFTWVPEFGSQKTVKPAVTQIKFGDGYEQRLANGLNTMAESWNLNFVHRESADALALIAFLETCAAVTAFDWTPPDTATEKEFVCRSWTVVPEKGGRFSITAQFEQVFEP
jgi:phage-related protein